MAKQFTDANFQTEVINSTLPSIVDFWAPWCGPCRLMGPIIDAVAKQFEGKINIGKVNVDENPNIPGEYSIMSIPTIIFFKDGKNIHQEVGTITQEQLESKIKSLLL
ncbi:MAG: thioredoxin [Candidatus Riflebacteria bacterium]|nr:thioredoxin [Candidatus Riflebacteria bacterium]